MDSCLKNMYDAFKDEILKELGPLDPNWFEVLTTQAFLDEGRDAEYDELCANQEGHFKAPLEKKAPDSQLFSTPKVFRHSRVVSPETEDEPSFTEKETIPWMPTQSSCLFQPSKQIASGVKCEGIQPQSEESFDLLDTLKKSPASYAKRISESLGVQMNPDISWTSSLNTPPALPSTLILSKTDESPCPVSVTADRNVVFVRKLFPSLSNSSPSTSKKIVATSSSQVGAVHPVANGCCESTSSQGESCLRQKVSNVVQGEEFCGTDGPKTFFANSSSALRKVKPERVKRKQVIQTNADNGASTKESAADLEPGGLPSTPLVKTGDAAISQWSPLNLSEISSCPLEGNVTLQGDADSVPLTRSSLKITDSGFTRKKREFVYIIETTKSQVQGEDSEIQKMDISPKISCSEQEVKAKSFVNTPGKAQCWTTENPRKIIEETITCSLDPKPEDIDMSQLCRVFAEDFTQLTDLKTAENTQSNFSPGACLSAMKQAKQKAKQANLSNDYIPTSNQPCLISECTVIDSGFQSGLADNTHMSSLSSCLSRSNVGESRPMLGIKTDMHHAPSLNESGEAKVDAEVPLQKLGKGQMPDYGNHIELHIKSTTEQSWNRDETACERIGDQPGTTPVSISSANSSGFKTTSNKGITVTPANLERAKSLFTEIEDKKTFREHDTKTYQASLDTATITPPTSKLNPKDEKSIGNISSQLTAFEKADVTELCTLLEEAESQFEFTQFKPAKRTQHCQDGQNTSQKLDKLDVDPALLADIDFDVSFSIDGVKHLVNNKVALSLDKKTTGEAAKAVNIFTGMSNSLTTEITSNTLVEKTSEDPKRLKLDEPNIFPEAENTKASKNNSTLMHSETFMIAEENVLKCSKKCKARTLFADLETDRKRTNKHNWETSSKTEQKNYVDSGAINKDSAFPNSFSKLQEVVSSDKNVKNVGNVDDIQGLKNNNVDTIICESGFKKASGKEISISAKYMKEADAFFNECHVMERKEHTSIKTLPDSVSGKRSFSNFKSPEVSISKERCPAHHTKEPCLEEVGMNSRLTPALRNEDAETFSTSKPFDTLCPSKSSDSSAFKELCTGNGFCTAAGKNIAVSAAAMRKAESLLNQIHTPEELNKEPYHTQKTLKCLNSGKSGATSATSLKSGALLRENDKSEDEIPVFSQHTSPKMSVTPVTNHWSAGFSAASGKPVVLSSKTLEKAKALCSDISLNVDNVAETAPPSKDREHKKDQSNAETIRCVSTPAGRAKDHRSEENLMEELDDLDLTEAMQEEVALHTDGDLGSKDAVLESVGSKKDNEKPHADQRMTAETFEEAGKGCNRDTDKQEKQKEKLLPLESCRSKMTDMKKYVSSEALQAAEPFLSDSVGSRDKVNAVPPESKYIAPPVRKDGFRSSGKSVALSSEALKKAKSLFSDISLSAEDPISSQTRSDQDQDSSSNTEKIYCGFTTARGENVNVLQKNLQKAKVLFKELDDPVLTKALQAEDALFADCDLDINTKRSERDFKAEVNMQKNRKPSLAKCHQDDKMGVNISTEPRCSREAEQQVEKRGNLLPQARQGFQTASGKRVDVSSEAIKRAKAMFSESDETEDKGNVATPQSKALPLRSGGFHSASGKQIALSTEDVQKAKSLFGDIAFGAEDPEWTKKTDGTPDNQTKTEKMPCGFKTARGEKVDVSPKNLQKAKVLFKEIDDLYLARTMQDADVFFYQDERLIVDNDGEKKQTNKVPINRSGGTKGNTSKLKPDERKTSSICEEPEICIVQAKQIDGAGSFPGLNGGFQTASGKTVSVTSEALSRAKLLLSENVEDKNRTCLQLPLSEAPIIDPTLTSGFLPASAKPVALSAEPLQKAFSAEVESFSKASIAASRGGMVCDLNPKSSIKTSAILQTNESSNLGGCTETQRKIFAQEALDCTKALLEDEVLRGQSLLMSSENQHLAVDQQANSKYAEEDTGRKRRSAEKLSAQPPSKRRLLEEFDRITDRPSGSRLHPVKSTPKGLTDRGAFRYSASLRPNITEPNRETKSFLNTGLQRTINKQDSDSGDGRSAPLMMPAFVPPFIRNTKRDILTNPEVRGHKKVPAFVPPFKKQRAAQQESFPEQQEDFKPHHSLVPNNKKDAPLTDIPQSSEDIIASVNCPNTETLTNRNLHTEFGSIGTTEMLQADDMRSRNQDWTQNIELARDMEDMRIRKKKRQTIRPLPGSLFLTKASGVKRIQLKAAVNGKPHAGYSARELYERGVHKHVPEITVGNAELFRFNLLQFIKQDTLADGGGLQLADGGWLIPSSDLTAGKEEFYRALCDTPGVDPKLISEQWAYNHYRWIVWKQASMEKSFPETMGSLCLTPEQVLLQLKYRYDVEVDHSRRPALRKIMERDDTPAKTLVLCVSEVVSRGPPLVAQNCCSAKASQRAETKPEAPFAVVCLTDGWYAIKAQLDEPLTAMLHRGLLAVGGKLIIHGAQLVGSQDACSPLEAPDSLMLKICANSTRRARWDTKLGFHRDPRPFLLPISSLYSNGGPVGCVDIIILRSYPMQWMERKSDGGIVFRSVRAEEKEERRFNSHKQKAIEMLFAKVQAEFEKEEEGSIKPQRRRKTINKQDIGNLQDGEELYEAVGDDPAYMQAHLSEQQMETLRAYRRSLMEKKQAELQDRYRSALDAEENFMSCPKRDVTPVWRLCMADSRLPYSCVYQLNLWRPSPDLQSLLREGGRFKVYNLIASDGKKRSGVETVQLTGTKKTQFQELQASQEWLSSRFQKRLSTDFEDLQSEEYNSLCGEVDLTGYVVSVIDQQGSSPAFHLVDGKLNFVKVRCFSSLSQAGLDDVVKPRVLLALSNLQLRGQSMHPTPVVYAGDLTAFSTNPKEIHLQESFLQLKNLMQFHDHFFLTAEEKLAHLVKSDGTNVVCSASSKPQTLVAAADRRRDSQTSVSFQKPVKNLGSFTPVSSNSPAAASSAEKDPKSLKRRRALDYLSRIPSPPLICPLGSVVSPCVNKTFNPPRRSEPSGTLKPVPKPAESLLEDEWVNDEELAMIDTQALNVGN